MAQERFTLTRAGYERLQRELRRLEIDLQQEIEDLRDVRGDDLPEFGEEPAFFDAMVSKEHVEERVGHLRHVLNYADIIDEDPDPETVSPGDRVIVWDFLENEELTFDLIGGEEVANGRKGVSIDSPVGQALLNRRVGEIVEADAPDGKMRFAIRRMTDIPAEG